MLKKILLALFFSALVSGASYADQTLAMQSGCLGCHKVDAKLVGPAFKDIAAKYAGDPAEIDRLTSKVKAGSTLSGRSFQGLRSFAEGTGKRFAEFSFPIRFTFEMSDKVSINHTCVSATKTDAAESKK